MSGGDYFHRVQEARALGRMRTLNAPVVTDERRRQIQIEMSALFVELDSQEPAEKIRRFNQMLELGRERGYVYDPDPAFDLVRIRSIRSWIAVEEGKLSAK